MDVNETLGYTSPGTNGALMTLQSNVSRSDGAPGNTTLTFQSYSGTATPGLQTYNGSLGNSVAPNQMSTTFTRGATYMLNNVLTLTAGDSVINVNGTTGVTAVPEPSSMAIAGLGALGMIGYGLRRRKALGA